jgi:hypothetical protein
LLCQCFNISAFTSSHLRHHGGRGDFREHGIEYRHPPRLDGDGKLNKSQLFLEFLPLVNARQVTLLRNERRVTPRACNAPPR